MNGKSRITFEIKTANMKGKNQIKETTDEYSFMTEIIWKGENAYEGLKKHTQLNYNWHYIITVFHQVKR